MLDLEPSDFNFCKDVWSVIMQFIPTLQLAKFRAVSTVFRRLVTTEMHKQCVTLDDPISIAYMVDFAYQGCIVSHVTYQGREYYPCDTYWCERPAHLPTQDYDPNLKCDADDGVKGKLKWFVKGLSQPDKDKWLSLQQAGTSCYEELATIFEGLPEMCPFYFHPPVIPNNSEQFIYHFDVADPNAMGYARKRLGAALMVFQGCSLVYLPHAMQLVNDQGMNGDHRGRNHLNIELDWHQEYIIPAGMHSVYDIVLSCFRIKGNKFENNYENFSSFIGYDGIDPDDPEDMAELSEVIDFDFDDSEWIVTPAIGHGS